MTREGCALSFYSTILSVSSATGSRAAVDLQAAEGYLIDSGEQLRKKRGWWLETIAPTPSYDHHPQRKCRTGDIAKTASETSLKSKRERVQLAGKVLSLTSKNPCCFLFGGVLDLSGVVKLSF